MQEVYCTDDGKDDYRNQFFLEGNWIVIRFSEKQVVQEPEQCCFFIAQAIDTISGNTKLCKRFDRKVKKLNLDHMWTVSDAKNMIKNKYRGGYLNRKE